MPNYYKNWDDIAKKMEDELEDNMAGDIIKAKNPEYKDNSPKT